jgi:uncharacterized protein (DUF2141 family)
MTLRTLRRAAAAGVFAAIALAGGACAQAECHGTPSANRLYVVVEAVRPGQGLVTSSLYTDDGRFLKKNGSLNVWRVPARAASVTMCVYLPRPGNYAVGVYQDLNSNTKIDRKMFPPGPAEPWGFTNNPHALFALPSFDQVRFAARAGDNTVHVRLNQP